MFCKNSEIQISFDLLGLVASKELYEVNHPWEVLDAFGLASNVHVIFFRSIFASPFPLIPVCLGT